MDELKRSIRRVSEKLRCVQEELQRAGLIATPATERARRRELARHLGSLYRRLLDFVSLHQATPALSPYRREPRRILTEAPRPD